jgi:hypothetical protein
MRQCDCPIQIGKERAMRPFIRDVGVNVIANLIAAAVIYITGVLAGLFTYKSNFFLGAVTTLVVPLPVARGKLSTSVKYSVALQ